MACSVKCKTVCGLRLSYTHGTSHAFDVLRFVGGGQYVLNTGVKKLSKMEWSHYTCKLLEKVPVQNFIRIFEACGLSEEIAQIPAKSRTLLCHYLIL